LAAAKKKAYVEKYGRPGAAKGWHFLTGDEDPIRQLANAVGFRYAYDEKTDQYVHASGIMLLTPQGKIARYFYGVMYSPRDLKFGLVETSAGKIGSPVEKGLLLLCFGYDAETGTYRVMVLKLVRLGGVVTVVVLMTVLVVAWRRERRKSRPEKNGTRM